MVIIISDLRAKKDINKTSTKFSNITGGAWTKWKREKKWMPAERRKNVILMLQNIIVSKALF